MAKRKSITGVGKKRTKPAPLHCPLGRSRTIRSSSSDIIVPDNTTRSTKLPANRGPSPAGLLLKKHEANREYQHRVRKALGTLEPRLRHVSQEVIRSRWTVLDENAQAKVAGILRSIELPVLARHTSEQMKIEAQVAMGSLTRALCQRLPKMPFPSKTKEEYLDYEALIRTHRNLQKLLAASLKSSASLRDETEKQRAALEVEQHELEDLEGSV